MTTKSGITDFFSTIADFEYLLDYGLPGVIKEKMKSHEKRLYLYDVGCSTGEATYSLTVIALESLRVLGESWDSWDVFVLGTDNNSERITTATRGMYNRSLRIGALTNINLRSPLSKIEIELYFEEEYKPFDSFRMKPNVRVKPVLRKRTHFVCENAETYKPNNLFDVIRCMALLRYREDDKLLINIGNFLRKDGLLITDEFPNRLKNYFEVHPQIYKKG